MRLVIEDADQAKIGLAPGEYDLDDLGAVKVAQRVAAAPGSHDDIEIELRLHSGMTPEPGSTGEPHFKVGVSVEHNPMMTDTSITAFGRPTSGQAYGYKKFVDSRDLAGSADPRALAEERARAAIEPVAREVTEALVAQAVAEVMGRPLLVANKPPSLDAFFGLPKKKAGCDECGDSGVWKNPANGHESDCSKGCAKP